MRFSTPIVLLALAACGSDPQVTAMTLELPLAAGLACASSNSPITGARLYVSGDLPPCDLVVDGDQVTGSCTDIPTGIDRYLVLRYSGANGAPIRYAITVAKLDAADLKGNKGKVNITFANDNVTGIFVDTDADVAQLTTSLYAATSTVGLAGARCFARSVIAADANNDEVAADCFTREDLSPVLDIDNDGCTNQRETCDGTSPTDPQSRACN